MQAATIQRPGIAAIAALVGSIRPMQCDIGARGGSSILTVDCALITLQVRPPADALGIVEQLTLAGRATCARHAVDQFSVVHAAGSEVIWLRWRLVPGSGLNPRLN